VRQSRAGARSAMMRAMRLRLLAVCLLAAYFLATAPGAAAG